MNGAALEQKTSHKGREKGKLQDLQRQGGGESIWMISEQIQGTSGHHGAKAKGCQKHCFHMCGTAQHADYTPGWTRQSTHHSK